MSIRIFPFPERLNQKWWYRLSKVIILVVSVFALIVGMIITWGAIDEGKIRHEIYNFEPGYNSNSHTAQPLNEWNASYDFIDRLIAASQDQSSKDREISLKLLSLYDLEKGFNVSNEFDVKDRLLKAIESDKSEKQYRIKIWQEYSFFPEILWLLIGPIVYLLLIGLYGVVLYIAYGANPFESFSFKKSAHLKESAKGFISTWKKICAFVLAFFVLGIILQVADSFEKWVKTTSTNPSSGMLDLVAVVNIASIIVGLIVAQKVYRSIIPIEPKK